MTRQLSPIGDLFRSARLRAGLSLESVASDLRTVTIAQLQAFEDCGGSLGLDDVFALTNILNIDPEEILRRLHPAAVEIAQKQYEEPTGQILVSGLAGSAKY